MKSTSHRTNHSHQARAATVKHRRRTIITIACAERRGKWEREREKRPTHVWLSADIAYTRTTRVNNLLPGAVTSLSDNARRAALKYCDSGRILQLPAAPRATLSLSLLYYDSDTCIFLLSLYYYVHSFVTLGLQVDKSRSITNSLLGNRRSYIARLICIINSPRVFKFFESNRVITFVSDEIYSERAYNRESRFFAARLYNRVGSRRHSHAHTILTSIQ